ncbi:MAG TPA: hypothetical protein VMR50_08495 [Myxococcota bacterium]|nr:hypothetical protein [Myxococcota bacterium]
MLFQRILVAALVPYVAWLVLAYRWHFLDGVNLLFHEAGHVFLAPFGAWLHMLGGTLSQLFFPAAAAFQLWREEREFEAWVCGIWLAESAMYMAAYMADAQAMALPLVGGDVHDWNWILARLGLLTWCGPLAWLTHGLASVLAVFCLVRAGILAAASPERSPR